MPQHIRLAQRISAVLAPEVLLVLVFVFAVLLSPIGLLAQIKWLIVILFANLITPLVWLKVLAKSGFVVDDTLENRELHRRRVIALFPLFVVIVIQLLIALSKDMPQPLTATLIATVSIMVVTGVVSFFWKISAHATGVATLLTFCVIFFGDWAMLGLFVLPLVAWSRVILHRHTFAQLVAGSFIAPIIILFVFSYLGLLPAV